MSSKRGKILRRIVSAMLMTGMLFTNTGMTVLAEALAEETVNAGQAVQENVEAGTEQTAEETEKAETEQVVTETQTEAVTTAETDTEAVTESEEITEAFTQSAAETETLTETVTEKESETESESEKETEKAVLDTTVRQEVIQKTLQDDQVRLMIKYTVQVSNRAQEADAENVSVKVLLAKALSYAKEDSESAELTYFKTMEEAADAFMDGELSEANRTGYAGCETVIWQDQSILAGTEKEFVFYAAVESDVTDTEALRNVWIINGDEITDSSKLQWINAELLAAEEELPSEYVFEDENMIVTAALSDPEILPAGARFVVVPAELTEEEQKKVQASLEDDEMMNGGVVYDMHFELDGQEIEPENGTIEISIVYKEAICLDRENADEAPSEENEYKVLHLKESTDGVTVEDVTDEIGQTAEGMIEQVGFTTESFSKFLLMRSTDIPSSDVTFEEEGGRYTLDDILGDYNFFVFGDATNLTHTVGAIIVEGNVSGTSNVYGQSSMNRSSFVKGIIKNLRPVNQAPITYLGKANTVSMKPGSETFVVNGEEWFWGVKGAVNDGYVDFVRAKQALQSQSEALMKRSSTVIEAEQIENGILTLKQGQHVKVPANLMPSITEVNVVTSPDMAGKGTVLSTDAERVVLPSLKIDNAEPQGGDDGNISFVWNMPRATEIEAQMDGSKEFGHIVATNAALKKGGGNTNGSFIVKSYDAGEAEAHMWPYDGDKLTPTFIAEKTVNGKTPTSKEVFDFILEELENGKWSLKQTKSNVGREILFDEIQYSTEGTFWYRISEKQVAKEGYTLSQNQYVVKIEVEAFVSGTTTSYKSKDTYYRVTDKKNLIKGDKINESAIKVFGKNEAPVFDNVKNESGETVEVSGSKTWKDNNNQDGKRPWKITINLLADGEVKESKIVTASDGWAWSFTNLPKYADGREIVYTITENEVEDYSSKVTGYDVTNTYTQKKVSVKVSKADIADGRKLEGAKLQVVGPDGKAVKEWISGKNEAETIENLTPGEEYTLKETAAPFGYDVILKDIRFKVDEDGKVTVTSTGKNADGKNEGTVNNNVLLVNDTAKPKEGSLIIRKILKTHGEIVEMDVNFEIGLFTDKEGTNLYRKAVFNMSSEPAEVKFDNLPEGTYYVYELDCAGNAITGNSGLAGELGDLGFESTITISRSGIVELAAGQNDTVPVVVTNEYPDLPEGYTKVSIDISGKKTWVDDSNAAKKRPGSLKLTLNGGTQDIALQSSDSSANYYIEWNKNAGTNEWTYVIKNVPKIDAGGNLIEYTVIEESVADYESESDEVTGERTESGDIVNADFKNTYEKPDLPSGNTNTAKKAKAAKTGDATDYMMYLLLVLAAGILGGTAIYTKKRKKSVR